MARLYDLSHLPNRPGVYCVKNLISGDFYVGAAKDIRNRARDHVKRIRAGLHTYAFNESFGTNCEIAEISVLEPCGIRRLNSREVFWIKKLKPNLNSRGKLKYMAAM